ncbi:reactive intermediate/imine deaminase [Campylobacter sp. MIT 12-5580]|uniref:Rid family detoxifying hydrolase n=1 Tax=Campylobacter sp. MIT 12-5580 TaxID=2040651 RepID=UPI0010F70AA1|nr:Rid family detoxifying hydrolase [Campylobacter sp. MIT 12-5580]TKX29309.1 reactive intermediate/imine deaminase [Campylobacter sp. MIT 12-5580]
MQTYPKAVGAYSAFRKAGDLIFISGQLGLDPQTNELVKGGVGEQTKQALNNIKAILKENGLEISQVVKTMVLLSDISDFAIMNEVYEKEFQAPFPARSAFAVKDLPKGAKVEIEAIAYKA